MYQKLKATVSSRDIDVVQIEHSFLAPYVDAIPRDAACKTALSLHNVGFKQYQRMLQMQSSMDEKLLGLLKWLLVLRLEKQYTRRFDLAITVEADLGAPSIQYVHNPWGYRPYQRLLSSAHSSLGTRLQVVFSVRCRPWRMLSGFSFDRMRANLTLVNSDWTGEAVRKVYNMATTTVYPPVPGDFPHYPWGTKENAFVCIGRLLPVKRLERIIDIIALARAHGENVRLHIVGKSQPNAQGYLAQLRDRVRDTGT